MLQNYVPILLFLILGGLFGCVLVGAGFVASTLLRNRRRRTAAEFNQADFVGERVREGAAVRRPGKIGTPPAIRCRRTRFPQHLFGERKALRRADPAGRSEEHTSELQSPLNL